MIELKNFENMPVKRFYDLLKWKTTLEEERRKIIEEGPPRK